MWMYVGTQTSKTSRGIYGLNLEPETGQFDEPKLMAQTANPTFLAMTALGDRLYAAGEPGEVNGKRTAAVVGFRIERGTRALTQINSQPSGDTGNCHVGVSSDGKWVAGADYGSGYVTLLPLRADGAIEPAVANIQHHGSGPAKDRQDKAHAHCATFDPSSRYLLACDLGTDEVYVYRIDNGLTQHGVFKVKPGSGPRHIDFSRDRRLIYLVNELDNTVDVLNWHAEAGTLEHAQRVGTLPPGFSGFSKAAEIAVHPSGHFVYANNRGSETIARFHVDPATGHLEPAGHTDVLGRSCRHFAIEPNGRFLVAANEESDNVVAFRINPETGDLTPTGSTVSLSKPMCVCFGLE